MIMLGNDRPRKMGFGKRDFIKSNFVFVLSCLAIYVTLAYSNDVIKTAMQKIYEIVEDNNKSPGSIRFDGNKHKLPESQILVYAHKNGKLTKGVIDKKKYSEIINEQVSMFVSSVEVIKENMTLSLAEGIDKIFEDIESRIPIFGDWYFMYGTQYQLLWESVIAGVMNYNNPDARSIVCDSVNQAILKQYEYKVLKPGITEEKIMLLYNGMLNETSTAWLKSIEKLEDDIEYYLSKNMSFVENNFNENNLRKVYLDWAAIKKKLYIAPDANIDLGGMRSLSGIGIGALVGKKVGYELASRISAHVGRNMLALQAIGASTGLLGGPLGGITGIVIGGTIGLGIDWIIHQGNTLYNRSTFELDVMESVNIVRLMMNSKLLAEMHKEIDIQQSELVRFALDYSQAL
jgi:hypothetical protein